MATRTLTPERALRGPLRVDLRAVLSLLVTIAAIGGKPLDANSFAVLTAADLKVAQVRVDDGIYVAAVLRDELGAVLSSAFAESAHARQMLVRAQISGQSRLAHDQQAFTIPVSAASAAGGQLRQGDKFQVLLTQNGGKSDAETIAAM